MAEQFDIDQRWPELFVGLDAHSRRTVVQSLASSWHEGWVPNREDVENLTDNARGTINGAEYLRQVGAVAERHRGSSSHNERGNYMVHPLKVEQASEADVARHLSFADGALGAAGHEVTDPYLRELVERQVRGELTGEEARALGVKHVLAR